MQDPLQRTCNSSFNFTEKKTNSKHSKTRVIKNHSEKDYKKTQTRSSSGGHREKIRQNAMILDAIAKFLNIKGKREQEKLHFNVPFAAEEESAEGIVLFENAESTFHLNGAVDAEQNAFVADDIVKRLSSML